MKCPFCSHENTRVIDSRPAEDNNSIRRRRVCDECDKRFTTYEKLETIPLIVIKSDNSREPFDRHKLLSGIMRACVKRPVPTADLEEIVDDIEISLDDLEATLKDQDFTDFDDFLDEEAAADADYLTGGGA